MGAMQQICRDLEAEHADLDAVVAALDASDWDRPTPAVGWSVRDQISHLGYFDRTAVLAVRDADEFTRSVEVLLAGGVDVSVEPGRGISAPELLAWWREGRRDLLATLEPLDPATRVPWYGPPMGARSFATARLMETWAHGQDIVDAVGAERPPTDRLRHIAHIGVRARPFSYAVRGLDAAQSAGGRRPDRPRRRAMGVGRGRRRVDHGTGARLLPGRDAAPASRRHRPGGTR